MATTDPKIATQGQWEDLADRVNAAVVVGETVSEPSTMTYVGTENIADNAITTDKLAANSVTSDKIDFATLDFASVQIKYNVSTSGNAAVSFTATDTDYLLVAFGSINNIWGYGGGIVSSSITVTPTPQPLSRSDDWMTGGNQIGRTLNTRAFAKLAKGTTYTITNTITTSEGPGTDVNNRLTAVIIPFKSLIDKS